MKNRSFSDDLLKADAGKQKRMPSLWHARTLTFVVLMVAVTNGFAQELRKEGHSYAAEMQRTFTAQPGGTLEMTGLRGDVEITTWQKNEVEILESLRMEVFTKEEAKRAVEATKASYRQVGDRIIVSGKERSPNRERSPNWMQSHFQVSLPGEFNLGITTAGGDISVRQVKGTITLDTSGGDITLIETGRSVHARTSGGDVIVRDADGDVKVETSGGDLELKGIKGLLTGTTSGGDITLRGAMKDVKLLTSGGDIEIADTDGAVTAMTSGGDIQIKDTRGRINIKTSGGDIDLQNLHEAVDAMTSGGDIEATGLLGTARLQTSGGDVQARDVQASIDVSTSGGDVEVEVTLKDLKKSHAITLKSSGGNLLLTIPEKLPAAIEAEIRLSDDSWRTWERYDISSDFPLKIQREEDRDKGRYIRAEGQINGGGDRITLTTSAGNITIRKLAP